MTSKLIAALFFIVVCQLLAGNISAQQAFSADELVGSYTITGFTGKELKLNADGTYSEKYYSCIYGTEESGKFGFINGSLHFTILKYIGKKWAKEKKEINLFNAKNRRKFYDYDDDEEVEPIPTEYELLPVRWDERIYLLDKDRLIAFINAVNLGFEPRNSEFSESSWGFIYLRKGDENKVVKGSPSLPKEWQSFILDNPVNAKIISIKEQDKGKLATIDKGSEDGLKVGMKLATTKEIPEWWSDEGEIVSVGEKTAEIITYRLSVGDSLSTKYFPK